MSTATAVSKAPLLDEGQSFWGHFLEECKKRMGKINEAAADHGECDRELLQARPGPDLHIVRDLYPSTSVRASLSFHSWGPMISGMVTGQEDGASRFSTEQFEFPIALDLDGKIVAVFLEGRSFSAQELACYLMQNFRRCYPGVTLPC